MGCKFSSTGKVSNGWIRNLGFNICLHYIKGVFLGRRYHLIVKQ